MESTFNLGFLLKLLMKGRGLLNIKTDYDGLREWLTELMALFDFLADQTAFDLDDDAVEFLAAVIKDDASYDAFYVIVEKALDKFNPDDEESDESSQSEVEVVDPILAFVQGELPAVTMMKARSTPATVASVDITAWVTIIVQVIQMVLQLLKASK